MDSQNVLSVSFMTIISLEKLFDWGGEQLAMYCGPDLGDLIIVTLNKYVRLISASLDYLLIVICDLQRRRSYPRHHSPYSMRVRVHDIFRTCPRYRLLLTYVDSSFSNPPSLVCAVLYVVAMGVHPHI